MIASTTSSWLHPADRNASKEGGLGRRRRMGGVGNLQKGVVRVKMIKMGL